jgi:serine/threonine-protein kinase
MSDTVLMTPGLPSHIGPGTLIDGKYRIEQQIGRGSMGTVFRAVHVTLGQRVAIKLISIEHSQSPEARQRFATEAKAAAKLRSRHVVQVYDDGETPEGNPYIVLEYLEGETLEQRLERERDIPLADATRVVCHVGRALARAHAHGTVHRDLKPANIFLVKTEDDEVGWLAKVLDFGIAKLADGGEKGTTQAGTVLGTPLFMSPEQVRGASSVDHRADLYSLGMCLFHMLTGDFAFYSENYSEILVSICTRPLPLVRAKAPWVPEAVELWFQRACAREPLERFQSADEMTEALQAAAGGPLLSKHKSAPEGRIAPATLVGLATPPQLAQDGMALARTLQLPHATSPEASAATSPGFGSPHGGPPPVSLAIQSEPRFVSGDFALPKRSLKPLVIGVGLALLAISTVAVTLFLLRSPAPAKSDASAPPPSALPPAPVIPPEPKTAPTTTAFVPATAVGSSVGAASAPVPKRPAAPGKRAPTAGPRVSPAPAPKATAAKPRSSDLGF